MATLDQDRVRFPGSGSVVEGNTPYGFYDSDAIFRRDAYSSMIWAARRMGYPIQEIELIDIDFYAAFEEAVNEYGSIVNQWNIVNNLSNFIGTPISSSFINPQTGLTGVAVDGAPIPYMVNLADSYGSEAGVGGKVSLKHGHIDTVAGKQTYDLQELWGDVSESFNRIEIRKIFHEMTPAFARIYDPFSMTGMSYSNVLTEMGFGGYSPAVQFLMTPIFEDLLRGQAIEFNDLVRKSAYSFEIMNNKIRIFPIPTYNMKMYFDYVVKEEKMSSTIASGSSYQNISDYSNIPYNNPVYTFINDTGKQWIRKYFLACCKETLGMIRQKYQTIPIPGGEVTLDGAELRSEAKEEKNKLIDDLNGMLEKASKTVQAEAKATEAEKLQDVLKRIPLKIYIGVWVSLFILIGIGI
jgi:hypothetical protein